MTLSTVFRVLMTAIAVETVPCSGQGLLFETNAGQTKSTVSFLSRLQGQTVFLDATGITLRTPDFIWKMDLVGANPGAVAAPLDSPRAYAHYLVGPQDQWHSDVPCYGKVKYSNVYPGIDLVYSGNEGRLQFSFTINPGADPSRIALQFHETEGVRFAGDSGIAVRASHHELRYSQPELYQSGTSGSLKIAGGFIAIGGEEIGVNVHHYDSRRPLIMTFSTYLGGTGEDSATAIFVDSSGNSYVAGWTESTDFPEAAGQRLGSPSGVDAFLAKLSPSGTLIYVTYLGGSGQDQAFGVAVDSSGSAVLAGCTYSTNFPTLNGIQRSPGGGKDGFVAKLNPAGNGLIFSTYVGGSSSDGLNAVALDGQGNIYVAGESTSPNFPVLNAAQPLWAGGDDAVISKFSSTGARLYSTYLGGTGDDRATAIAVDAFGYAYITGSTYSANFPIANAFQSKIGDGQDAFAAKISAAGTALVYSTFLGGSGGSVGAPETGNGIAVDSAGCAYIAGTTNSANFPVVNPLQSALNGGEDAFVLKLNASGSALLYSTYLGGSSIDVATAIALDGSGSAYVAGYTASTDFPIVNAVQSANAGGYDAFVIRLSSTGSSLEMGTYLGGTGSDSAYGIAVDTGSNIYAAGQTLSNDFPTNNANQSFQISSLGAAVFSIAGASRPAAASFVKLDTTTQGIWKGIYGVDGFAIAGDSASYPAYSQVSINGQFSYTWNPSTTDPRALQKANAADRIAALWGAWSTSTLDVNLTDGVTHQIALYCIDWDSTVRNQRIDVVDATSGALLDSRNISNFNSGQYLVWNIAGHVLFRITLLGGSNAVVSGMFFGRGPQASVGFIKQDTSTQGTWKGLYGADGFAIAGDSDSYPAYSKVSINGQFSYTWNPSTPDPRALQKTNAADRIAALWGTWSTSTLDVTLTDGATHQIALYCIDWDSTVRNQRIDVVDATSGALLDSRNISNFNSGQYLVWNIAGHVLFRITLLGGSNAVVSGVFFK